MAHNTQKTWMAHTELESCDQFVYQGPWKVGQVFIHRASGLTGNIHVTPRNHFSFSGLRLRRPGNKMSLWPSYKKPERAQEPDIHFPVVLPLLGVPH